MRIDCPDLCLRYIARVIRGVKIGPSPKWMVRRLETVGITPINNVVDISNYVLMECGQPLHTFDFGKLQGRRRSSFAVRCPARRSRRSITRRTAWARDVHDLRRSAAGGHRRRDGRGADRDFAATTRDVLIEAAEFDPVSIRNTARQLNLHSDSSYRFERRIDPRGARLGQPPLLRVDSRNGRRRVGRRGGRRRPAAAAARADRAAAFANRSGFSASTCRRSGCGRFWWRWGTRKSV